MNKRNIWTPEKINILIEKYPNEKADELAKEFGFTIRSVYDKAQSLGLKKSKEFMSSKASGILIKGTECGKEFRFQKGHIPVNKGLKLPGSGNIASFKKGNLPHNTKHDGFESVRSQGYVWVRISFKNWKMKHRVVWEQHNGPIPKDKILTFKDGNKLNCDISNLELISRQESMQRGTLHNYPEELKQLIITKGHLTRQINKKNNETKN